jgi:hypothetical protein
MMNALLRSGLLYCTVLGGLLLPASGAAAAELGDLCWRTDTGTVLRFSLTQSGAGHFTYTGLFDDGDGATFSIMGQVQFSNAANPIAGSFSGSKSTASNFKTSIWQVSFSPTLTGSAEGIVQVFDRASATVSSVYRTHTLTPAPCP